MTHAPFKLNWDLEYLRFCTCPLKAESPLVFKARCLGGLSAQSEASGLRSPIWVLDPSFFEEELYNLDIPSVTNPEVWVLTILPLSLSHPSCFHFFLMSLVVENLLLVFWPFPQSCSVNTVDLAFLDFSFLSVIKGK